MIVASMLVKMNLADVGVAINGFVRDGVILPSGFLVNDLEISECTQIANSMRRVWCVGRSAVFAESRADNCTELKLVAVKGIIHNDGVAHRDWGLVKNEFERAQVLLSSKTSSRMDTGDIPTVLEERDLIEGPRPEFGDEQRFKEQWTDYFKTHMVYDRNHQGRQLNDGEAENEVKQIWEIHKRNVVESQTRWDEIHRLTKLTTEEATVEYLGGLVKSGEPTNVPKTKEWTRDQKIAVTSVIVAIIIPILIALIQQGVIPNPLSVVAPTLPPVFVLPTPTP